VKRKLLFGLVAATLVVGVTLAGCAPTPEAPPEVTPPEVTPPEVTPPEEAPPAEEEAIIIPWGTASCLSGPYASWGMEEHYIQEMQVDDINSGGGCWGGILGHEPGFRVKGQLYNWKIIAYDAKMDPTEGVKVVSRLIYKDKANFIHVFMDQVYFAAKPMFLENKCLVTIQGCSPDDLGPSNPYTFRTLLTIPEVNPLIYDKWIVDELKPKTLVGFSGDAEHPVTDWNFHKKTFEALGVDIAAEEFHEMGATDYTAPLSKIISLNPDMIFLPVDPSEEAGLIVKQARELGYEGIFFNSSPSATPTLVGLAGWDNLEGYYCGNAVSPPFPYDYQQWFYDEYTKRHGVDAWSGGLIDRADDPYNLTLAIEKANSLDTEEVTKAWESMTSPGETFSFFGPDSYMGGASIYGNNHALVPRHWISVITGGKEVQVIEIAPPPGI